jgi:hypothetical protein
MRRLAAIAAFALFLAVPLWAQHGGGHGGGGFGGGHAGGFSGHAGGSIAHSGGFSGSRASGFSGRTSRSFTPPASAHNFSSRGPFLHNGVGSVRIRTNGFGNGCYGYLCRGYGYGYYPWGWGYYDPSWWWDNSSNDDSSQDVAAAAEMNRENLEEQRMLRQEQADGDQDSYSSQYDGPHHSYRSDGDPQTPEKKGSPMFSDTVLVFRDKHQQEVENYAIVGDTLWSFAPQHTQKIALDDLDLAATKKANEDRGMTFRLPSGS